MTSTLNSNKTYCDSAVVAGTAGDEQQSATAAYLLHIVLDPAENDLTRLKVNTTPHRV